MTAAGLVGRLLPVGSRRRHLARRLRRLARPWVRWSEGRDDRDLRQRLEQWAAGHPVATIVQIGAHNGQGDDPLADLIDAYPAWRVLFVEPMPDHFAALTAHRGGQDRFTLVQAAVTDHDGEVTMTTVDRTDVMPEWADQLTSIHRETVLKHAEFVPGLEAAIREVAVPAVTFATLMTLAPSGQIDLLHIDTEGHDAAILDQIDLDRASPEVILFERKHLSPDDRTRCERRLEASGYALRTYHSDTLAMRSN